MHQLTVREGHGTFGRTVQLGHTLEEECKPAHLQEHTNAHFCFRFRCVLQICGVH